EATATYQAAVSAGRAGDLAREEQLLIRAIGLVEGVLGPEHRNVGVAVRELGLLYFKKRDFARATKALERAEAIFAKIRDPLALTTLNELGEVYREPGDLAKATRAHDAALAATTGLGEMPEKATTLNELALEADERGDYARAESLLLQAIAIREK